MNKPFGQVGHVGRKVAKAGSALIIALWVLLILALLISGFAFDMYVESSVTAHFRQRTKAQYLAQAGVEYARMLLTKSLNVKPDGPGEGEDEETWTATLNLSRGVGLTGLSRELGAGRYLLDLLPEQGRRNVNQLSDDDWEEILDQAGVPQEQWGELIDCFSDWVDDDDAHRLLGAESDDAFYEDRGYKVKNAAVDTVDEMLLIKGFTPQILYGGPAPDQEGTPLLGIAKWLTTWGDGKVNVNTASREVLMTISGLDPHHVEGLLAGRLGPDRTPGTRDDGFENVEAAMAYIGLTNPEVAARLTVKGENIVRVVSIGEVGEVRAGIWCILRAADQKVVPLFWREEMMD